MCNDENRISEEDKYPVVSGIKMELEYENGYNHWCDQLIEDCVSQILEETDDAIKDGLINDIGWLRYKRNKGQTPGHIKQRLLEDIIFYETDEITDTDIEMLDPYIDFIEEMIPDIDDYNLKLICLNKIAKYDIRYLKTCISSKEIFNRILQESVEENLENIDHLNIQKRKIEEAE